MATVYLGSTPDVFQNAKISRPAETCTGPRCFGLQNERPQKRASQAFRAVFGEIVVDGAEPHALELTNSWRDVQMLINVSRNVPRRSLLAASGR